jgi:hypothetical protein
MPSMITYVRCTYAMKTYVIMLLVMNGRVCERFRRVRRGAPAGTVCPRQQANVVALDTISACGLGVPIALSRTRTVTQLLA